MPDPILLTDAHDVFKISATIPSLTLQSARNYLKFYLNFKQGGGWKQELHLDIDQILFIESTTRGKFCHGSANKKTKKNYDPLQEVMPPCSAVLMQKFIWQSSAMLFVNRKYESTPYVQVFVDVFQTNELSVNLIYVCFSTV